MFKEMVKNSAENTYLYKEMMKQMKEWFTAPVLSFHSKYRVNTDIYRSIFSQILVQSRAAVRELLIADCRLGLLPICQVGISIKISPNLVREINGCLLGI
jgi:hypothetical protein